MCLGLEPLCASYKREIIKMQIASWEKRVAGAVDLRKFRVIY